MRFPMLAALGASLLASAGPALADADRAARNYQAVLNGTLQLAELTPAEVREWCCDLHVAMKYLGDNWYLISEAYD